MTAPQRTKHTFSGTALPGTRRAHTICLESWTLLHAYHASPPDQWPPCLRCCGLAPEIPDEHIKSGTALDFLSALHDMFVAILQAQKLRDAQSPVIFTGPTLSRQVRQYPYHQLVGPLPRPEEKGTLLLRTPKKPEWQWEMPFLADLLRWLRALTWTQEPGTLTFLELALDFEEFAQRTLPHAPQAKFKGSTLSLQERGRVLRLAITSAQRLVAKGQLHPARIVTQCNSLVPLGGPALCGPNRRPYFACRTALHTHILKLAEYCEHPWAAKVGILRAQAPRAYAFRPRRSAQEVEEHRLHRALQGDLQTGLAPSSEQVMSAKGGGGVQLFFRGRFLSDHWGWQTPTAPLHRHAQTHNHTQSAAASATAWPGAMLCALSHSVYDVQATTEDSRRVLSAGPSRR